MNPLKDVQSKKYSESFRLRKYVELMLMIIFAFIYIVLFLGVPEMRDYTEHSSLLKITHIIIFAIVIFGTFSIISDIRKYVPVIKEFEEQKKKSYLDKLTGIPNRLSCDLVFEMYGKKDSLDKVGCAIIEISNLYEINSKKGRNAGNQALVDFSWMLEGVSESFGFVGRNGGNEFLLIIDKCNREMMEDFFAQLDMRIRSYNLQKEKENIEIKYNYVLNSELNMTKFSDIIAKAYSNLK